MSNQKMINIKILIAIFGFLVIGILLFVNSDIVDDKYILLEFSYSNDSITLLSKSLETGNYPEILHETELDYRLNLIADNGDNLYSRFFNNPTLLFTDFVDDGLEGGVVELTETTLLVAIPNYEESEKIEIFKGDEKIFEEGVYDVGATSCKIK